MSALAGWFPDPENPGQQRYWDGVAWTDHRAPLNPPVENPPTPPAPPPSSQTVLAPAQHPTSAATDKKAMGTGAKIAIGIGAAFAGLIVIGVIGAALGAGDEETLGATPTTEAPQNDPTDTETKASESPTESSTEASPSPTEESDPVALSGSGVYLVPQEIKPGTYTAPDAKGCYWERLKGLGGGFNAIITNGNAAGPIVVTIGAQDKAFNSDGCGDWYKGTPVITDDPTKISDGIWSVPENVKPGTYRTQAKGCYWARLSNFSGGFSGIIANNNVNGQALVKISASDAGFESTRCGTWERVG